MRRPDKFLWRIARDTDKYSADDLTGNGARITRGCWNSQGHAVLYASDSIALSTLETLVGLGPNIAIRNTFLVRITVPRNIWAMRDTRHADSLPVAWVAEPPGTASTGIGDAWLLTGTAPLLLVPSVIVPEEYNVLINPAHPAVAAITAKVVRQFIYDPRLK